MKKRILDYINDSTTLYRNKGRGIPGLHAEVQAVNDVLNRMEGKFDPAKINVSTIKLLPGVDQGSPFPACRNCAGILQGFNILTGVK